MGKILATSVVDRRHRIVLGKQIRRKMNIKAGDVVIIEPLDENSLRVMAMDFNAESLEDDPAWKALHMPVKAEEHIPPDKLEEIMEEEVWRG